MSFIKADDSIRVKKYFIFILNYTLKLYKHLMKNKGNKL